METHSDQQLNNCDIKLCEHNLNKRDSREYNNRNNFLVSVFTQIDWAFGSINNNLQKRIKIPQLKIINWRNWNHSELNGDLIYAQCWDVAYNCMTKHFPDKTSKIIFSVHGIAELFDHYIANGEIKYRDISKQIIEDFQIAPELIDFFKLQRAISVVSNELLQLLQAPPYCLTNLYLTTAGVDGSIYFPSTKLPDKEKPLRIVAIGKHPNETSGHGYDVKRKNILYKIKDKMSANNIIFDYTNHLLQENELPEFYRAGDVYIAVGHSEGAPLGCLNAGACGLVVISTRVGCMPEFIDHGVDGYIVGNIKSSDDEIVDEICNYLKILNEDRDLLCAMKQKRIEKAPLWDWDVKCEPWADFFAKCIDTSDTSLRHYNWIEIGTGDFNTLAQTRLPNEIGICVEPIKTYIDALPKRDTVIKVNAAIGINNSTAQVYYVTPANIERLGLPQWVRGCNTLFKPHKYALQQVTKYVERNNIQVSAESFFKVDDVSVITYRDLLKKYNVGSVDYLKCDTEGADCMIMSQVIQLGKEYPNTRPKKIMFESNENASPDEVSKIIEQFKTIGYELISRGDLTIVQLNN